MIVLSPADPRIVIAEAIAAAFTLMKPVTSVEPPVWFTLLARLMFVAASRTSVDKPEPAAIDASDP